MDGGQKEIKRILQIATDSLKSLEYLQMVLNERVKVEEHYLQGLNKVQGQLNFVREGDPLLFECSALRVDTSQRASHTAYLIEQMKGEQEDISSILKENGDRLKESENFFRESEKNFRSQMQALDKQKEKLSQAHKEVEEACLYFGLVQDEVPSDVQKWKERRSQVLERLKTSLQNKNELAEQYSRELASSNGAVTDWNTELPGKYEQLVVSLDNLKRDINDIARKQMVFEVNQIRNIQYDLSNVIGQVDSRPSFITSRQQVTLRTSIHKPLNFHSFFSNLTARLIKSAEEILEGNTSVENNNNVEQKDEADGVTSRTMTAIVEEAVLGKEERQAIQSYFQSAILQQSNDLSLLKRKSIRDACHYLVNSVVKEQGDCADLDVINIDITVFLQELNRRGMNSKLAQQALEAKSNSNNENIASSNNEKNSRNNSSSAGEGGVDGNNNNNNMTNTVKEVNAVSQTVVESSKEQVSEQGNDQQNQEKDTGKEQGQQGQSSNNEETQPQQDSNGKVENEKEKSQSNSRKSSTNSHKNSPQKEQEQQQQEEEKTEDIAVVVNDDGINSAKVNVEGDSIKEQAEKDEDVKEKEEEVTTIPTEKQDSQVEAANEPVNSIKETESAQESKNDPAVTESKQALDDTKDKTNIESVEIVPKGEDALDANKEDAKEIKVDLTMEDKQTQEKDEGQEGQLSDKLEETDKPQASEDIAAQQQLSSLAAGRTDDNANSKAEEQKESQEGQKEKESTGAQVEQETAAVDIVNTAKEATISAGTEETQVVVAQKEPLTTQKSNESTSETSQPAASASNNDTTSQQETQSIQPQQQPLSQPQSPQEILEAAPLSLSFSSLENGEIFLLFLESFRQCGRGQLTVGSGNQLISECFRYMDYLESEKNTSLVTQFMPLTLAIHRNTSVEKVYLQDKVKNHQLWAYNDLWETMIYTQTHNELAGLDASVQNELPVYQATVYANLSAIGLNMLKFRATKTYTKNILAKLSNGYSLPANMLGELATFVENIGQTEKTLSFVKNLQAKPNISGGRVVIFGGSSQYQQQQQQQQPQQVLQQSQSLQSSGIRSSQTGSTTNINVSSQPRAAGGTDSRTGVVGASSNNTRLTMSAFPTATTTTQNKDNTVNTLSWQSPQQQPLQQQLFQKPPPPMPVILQQQQQQQQQSAVKSSSADVASAFSPESTPQQQQQQQQVFLSTRTASTSSVNTSAYISSSSNNPFTNPISLVDPQISQQQQSSPQRHLSTDLANQGELLAQQQQQQQSTLDPQQLSSILKAAQSEAAAEQLTYGNQQIYKAQTAPGVFVIKQQPHQPITSNPSNNLQHPQQQQQPPQAVQPSVKPPNASSVIGSQQIPLAVQQTASQMNEQSIQANLINAAKRNSSKFSMSLFGAAGSNKPIGNNFAINPNNSNNNNNQAANLNNKKL